MRLSELKISRTALVQIADDYIWNARNKEILYKKMEGYTHEEIAEMYNLSTQRVKEIIKNCIIVISEHS